MPATDPHLVHRAEQAYLGALLARQGRVGTGTADAGATGPGGFAVLRPQDFTNPVHQAIYAAVAEQMTARPGGAAVLLERLRGLLARLFSTRARAASTYMAELPGMCPDPANLPAYAAMIAEARQPGTGPGSAPAPQALRPAAGSPVLAGAGQWLGSNGPAPRRTRSPSRDTGAEAAAPREDRARDGMDRGTARLARALRADARSATPPVEGEAWRPVPPQNQPAGLAVKDLEEQVLADLMHRPAAGRDITAWLPSTVFTSDPNRTLYRLIGMRLAEGRPVDPLIIAWDASQLRGPGNIAGAPGAADTEPLAAAVLRVGALDPAPGTAAVLGQALYAEQVCTSAFGPDWRTARRIPPPAPAPATPARGGQQQPAPAPAARQAIIDPDQPASYAAPQDPRTPRVPAPDVSRVPPPPALPLRRPPAPGPAGPAPAQRP